jgi:hypothetical protein
VGKPEGKRPLGRPLCRWVDNTKMDLKQIGWGNMEWIHLAQDFNQWRTLVYAECIEYWKILERLSDWRLLKKNPAPWSSVS